MAKNVDLDKGEDGGGEQKVVLPDSEAGIKKRKLGDHSENPQNSEDLVELESKKPKRTPQQEIALDELSNCDAILKSQAVNLDTKMTTLANFFNSLVKHNINILLLKEDFNDWVKASTLAILQDVRHTSTVFFIYLKSALRTAPTIFESICDQVLPVAMFYPKEDETALASYSEFLKLLVYTFEKLRRFPKLVAKLLCCIRDYDCNKRYGHVAEAKNTGKMKPVPLDCSVMLPAEFIEAIGPTISLLPGGQIIDLWRTLHHNATEECLKKLSSLKTANTVPVFLDVITLIFIEFFKNIKLADSVVPETILERASELMTKFRDECLNPLGNLSLQKHGLEFSKPFLQLAYTWAELHGLLLHYNLKYKRIAPVPVVEQNSSSTNLTYLHPYLEVDQWSKLTKVIQDSPHFEYLINLVAQKVRFMTVMENVNRPTSLKLESGDDSQLVEDHIKNAAKFLWVEQLKLEDPTVDSMEICSLAAEYMSTEDTIKLGNNFIRKIAKRETDVDGSYYDLINSACNHQFHCGLVLESLVEVLKRLEKMKILQSEMKVFLKDTFSVENRAGILQAAGCNVKENISEENQKELNAKLLHAVNKIIKRAVRNTESATPKAKKVDPLGSHDEFSDDLICDMLKYLSELPVEDYPLNMKTVLFLCSVPILISVVESASKDLVDMVGHIFTKCGSSSQGNETLFAVKWTTMFKWFCGHIDHFSENVQKEVINVILRNIYISSQSVADFEDEFTIVCESEMASSMGLVASLILEFLTMELQQGTKTKLTHQLQTHTRKLTHFVVNSLQGSLDDIGNYGQFNAYLVEASSYRTCWLTQISLKALSKCEIERPEEDLSQFKLVVSRKVGKAIAFLSTDDKLEAEADSYQAKMYAMKFLHGICKAKEEFKDAIPDDFVLQLWNVAMMNGAHENIDESICTKDSIIPKHLLKDIFEAASKDEFEGIHSLIVKMTIQSDPSTTKIRAMIRVLEDLIDAELISEKKQTRWKILEECLHAFLVLSMKWEPTEDCLRSIVFPFVAFQTKLLRRRSPMGSLTTLATCLASTETVPINKITEIALYAKMFCSVADLLNAFALHRLDVISFRTHIFLQGFQFLVESLFGRADQKNNLSDVDIFHMRHCAHSIERICQSMKLGQKEFSRVSPYFVAVLIRQLEQCTVYPVVKNPLLSGCYKLLDLCDEHGVGQLNSMLSAGSREVFKPIYEMYKRFYRYKGKV